MTRNQEATKMIIFNKYRCYKFEQSWCREGADRIIGYYPMGRGRGRTLWLRLVFVTFCLCICLCRWTCIFMYFCNFVAHYDAGRVQIRSLGWGGSLWLWLVFVSLLPAYSPLPHQSIIHPTMCWWGRWFFEALWQTNKKLLISGKWQIDITDMDVSITIQHNGSSN